MPNDLRLRVGAATGTITFNPALSDAQVANALRRYARSLGIPTDGTPQENLTAILQHWLDDVRRRSKAVQLADLAAERAASDAKLSAVQATALATEIGKKDAEVVGSAKSGLSRKEIAADLIAMLKGETVTDATIDAQAQAEVKG